MLYQRSLSYRKTLRFLDIKNDSIDISCGDGVFSFLTFGGQLSADSDMFRSIKYEKNISKKKIILISMTMIILLKLKRNQL